MIAFVICTKRSVRLIVNISFVTCGDYHIKYTNARITIHTRFASMLVVLGELVGALGTLVKYR